MALKSERRQCAGGPHHPHAGNQLYALRHERHREPRSAEIDGFKPAHRKLLYTMYEMGLLKGARTKSANIVGSTMHLNPHGDAAIYDTMVRMGRGNESLLMPFVDSKGNFGKAYSRDMSCAAARYTEAKLENVCESCSATSTRRPWILCPTTTAPPPSLPCCR